MKCVVVDFFVVVDRLIVDTVVATNKSVVDMVFIEGFDIDMMPVQ